MEDSPAASWEHFHHVADIGVRGTGPTLAEAFAQAARALTAVIVDPDAVAAREVVEVGVAAADDEILLTEWLDALVYEMATRKMLFSRFEVHIEGHRLEARAWGEPIEVARHQPTVEIKGATLTELRVWKDADGLWHAQCVVDV